ncbi:winged helix DNA-binding protein [Saccharopolyspora shandongensis]
MEAKGLVERVRDPDDRRSVRVRLTVHGIDVVDRIFRSTWPTRRGCCRTTNPPTTRTSPGELRRLLEDFGDRLDRGRATGKPVENG